MSDHNHECPQCNGFYECDRDDCKEDDLCLECEIINRDATIAALRAEVERLKALENKMGSGWALVEYEELQKRLAEAEKMVEGVRHVVRLVKSKELDYLGGYLALENITEEKIFGEP